jgi:hypothetical protein
MWRRSPLVRIAILAAVVVSGCTHAIRLHNFEHGSGMAGELKGKRIAIVLDSGRINDNHTTSSDVHKFDFSGATEGLTKALKERIGPDAKTVEVFQAKDLPKDKEYDYYIYPDFTIRSVNDFWSLGCLVNIKLTAKSNGRNVASESAQAKRSFAWMSSAESQCNRATSDAFNAVADKFFGAL